MPIPRWEEIPQEDKDEVREMLKTDEGRKEFAEEVLTRLNDPRADYYSIARRVLELAVDQNDLSKVMQIINNRLNPEQFAELRNTALRDAMTKAEVQRGISGTENPNVL